MDKDEVKAIHDRLSVRAKFIVSQMDEDSRYSISSILEFFSDLNLTNGKAAIEELIEFDPQLIRVDENGRIELTIIGAMIASDTLFYKDAASAMAARTADIDQDLASGEEALLEILEQCDPKTLTQVVSRLEQIQQEGLEDAQTVDDVVERFVSLFGVIKFNTVLARWVQMCADRSNDKE